MTIIVQILILIPNLIYFICIACRLLRNVGNYNIFNFNRNGNPDRPTNSEDSEKDHEHDHELHEHEQQLISHYKEHSDVADGERTTTIF